MLHFYESPKGDFVNFRQMTSIIRSHEMAWIVDESGQRFKVGHEDDIPCFINFLNDAILEENQIVSHEDFAVYRQAAKIASGEIPPPEGPPATHEELDHPPGVGIPPTYGGPSIKKGSTPPLAPPPPEGSVDFGEGVETQRDNLPTKPQTKEEFEALKAKEKSNLMYPPDEGDGAKDIAGDQPPPKKGKGGKKR